MATEAGTSEVGPGGEGLAGQVVLVSGAAAGIGRAVAEAFAARGCRLALVDISAPALDRLGEELAESGAAVEVFIADATDGKAVESAVRGAVDAFGRLDVLINVVGGSRPGKDVVELTEPEWADMLRFNLTSAYLMCHHAITPMAAGGGGVIVNVSSGAGIRGMRKNPGYCAAKAGVVGLTKALAIDHADQQIRVNAVAPGPVLTPLMRRNRTPEQIEQLARISLVGRVADPAEVAEAVVFLAGRHASYINGQTIEVDGGVRGSV